MNGTYRHATLQRRMDISEIFQSIPPLSSLSFVSPLTLFLPFLFFSSFHFIFLDSLFFSFLFLYSDMHMEMMCLITSLSYLEVDITTV